MNSKTQDKLSVWFVYSDSDDDPCLSNPVLIQLEEYFRRLSSSQFFKALEIDKIHNLFRVLERSIRNGDKALVPSSDILELDLVDLDRTLHILDNSLKAIKVFFRIWLSGRSENELFSEDLLTSITELYSKLFDISVLPFCEKELTSNPVLKFRSQFGSICQELTRITDCYSEFITVAQLNEASVTKLEFLTIRIVFQEVLTRQKDLLITLTNMESLRASTIVLISTIYGNFPDQQGFILDEILGNVTKLNGAKSSRAYKLQNGTSIQLLSALITKLIQTTGPLDDAMFHMNLDDLEEEVLLERKEQLTDLCTKRITSASKSAAEILQYLISRAIKTTKSDFAPFRVIIDNLTEDMSKLLFNPEWPAAELLLSTLASLFMRILEDDKEGVMASTMAIEVLGNIEAKLYYFHKHQDEIIELALNMPMLSFGEYTDIAGKVLFHLQSMVTKDTGALNAYRYLICLFTSIISSLWYGTEGEDGDQELHQAVTVYLDTILTNGKEGFWQDSGSVIDITNTPLNENYRRFLFSRNLVQLYDRVLNSILGSLNHSKINIRTKALRTISNLLEQSPDIFSLPQIQNSLNQRIFDPSSQVRDATVDIIGKYILLKPETAKTFYMILCDRSNDTGLAVRKRVIKLLHDLYFIVDDKEIKVEIAERIIRRVDDEEKAINELSTSFLTEFFFPPLKRKGSGDIVNQHEYRKATKGVISILAEIWSKGEKNSRFLSTFFSQLFHSAKGVASHDVIESAKSIVSTLAEEASTCNEPKQSEPLLGILSTIVGANGSFVTQDQLSLLKTFIVDQSPQAQICCQHVLSIFHQSLDKVGPLRPQFLQETQADLLKRLSKFTVGQLCEGVPCLWIVSVMMNDKAKLVTVGKSCLKAVLNIQEQQKKGNWANNAENLKAQKLLFILGNIGRYCDIDDFINDFAEFQREKVAKSKPAKSVTELIIRILMSFTNLSFPLSIQKVAVRNCCAVCISHPLFFLTESFLSLFDRIFKSDKKDLKITVIRSMIELLNYEELTANSTAAMKNTKRPDKVDLSVFYGTTKKFHNEGASTSLMQRYLDNITDLSLSEDVETAYNAALLLERIVTQGLANPRLVFGTVIALETSRVPDIIKIAKNMHTKLYEKHESIIEGSYVDGVRHAASYRIRLAAAIEDEYDSFSVFYQFLKSNRAGKRKFLLGICRTLDFDATDSVEELEAHYKYIVFVANSLSTLSFYNTEEVLTLIAGLDKIISGTGVTITHNIDKIMEKVEEADESNKPKSVGKSEHQNDFSEMLDVTVVDDIITIDEPALDRSNGASSSRTLFSDKKDLEEILDSSEVSKLARSAVMIHILWNLRNFLKRAYGITEEKIREFNPNKPGKDPKPASRSTSQIHERLTLGKVMDLSSSYDVITSNIIRLRAFADEVSPESLNADEFFEAVEDDDNTLVTGSELLPSRKKRGNAQNGNVSQKRVKYD